MLRRISRVVSGRAAGPAAAVMLVLAAVAAAPAVPAQAASSVPEVFVGPAGTRNPNWGSLDNGSQTPWTCAYAWQTQQHSEQVDEIYNPCNTRMWVHYYYGSTYAEICVNPGGGLAYSVPFLTAWKSGDTADIQLSGNTSPCLANTLGLQVTWSDGTRDQDYCGIAESTSSSANWITAAINSCDTRVWLHIDNSGKGVTICLDNYNSGAENSYYLNPTSATTFFQYQLTLNQAPCSAGGAPYSY